MFNSFEFLNGILGHPYVLLGVMALSLFCKFYLFSICIRYCLQNEKSIQLLLLLMLFLLGAMLDDSFYILSIIVRRIFEIRTIIPNFTLASRIDWIFFITQYQAIALFLEHLIEKKIRLRLWLIPHVFMNLSISFGFIYLAIFKYYVPSTSPETLFYELMLVKISYAYLPFLFAPVFYKLFKRVRSQKIPLILAHQLKFLTAFFIPYLFLETVNSPISYLGFLLPLFSLHGYAFFTLTTIICTYAMFYVSKSIMGLRFLNLRSSVESKEKFNFLAQFRDILDQLIAAKTLNELPFIAHTFFNAAFSIPLNQTRLVIRKIEIENHSKTEDYAHISAKVEHFLTKKENHTALHLLRTSKIFIRTEIDFTHFYEEDQTSKEILEFLDDINADIFLPLYERSGIAAYIIVQRNAQATKLFTNKERDEMLVFISYLSNIINVLKHSDFELLHRERKQLTEELYHKHQENNQYRESIRSFMRLSKERKVGIIYYKHRTFTMINEAAQELVGFDLNMNLGHTLTQTLRAVARRVQDLKTAQSALVRDASGTKMVIAGIPALENYTTILQISYPEISDIVKSQFDKLKDPSAWDYALYLETTQSGQLINHLLPGTGETILNFKINLLSTALSKKATLLAMPEDDLMPAVEILHTVSLRKTLHTLKLIREEQHDESAITLFGLNPLMQKKEVVSLLEKLDNTGTLFIENIEYLSLQTQEQLAQFIAYGSFHQYKSDHKIYSNVRIIGSSTKNLQLLTEAGTFSKALFKELQSTSLVMPPLHSFSEQEIDELIEGFADQIVTCDTYTNLLKLTDKDKAKFYSERPASLREFKEKVHQLILQKSHSNNIQEVTSLDPAYNVQDPDLAHAIRLGKKALKDPQAMAALWNKFKNQNKIATLLGVNRSSVNRRCQEYNLK